MSIRRPEGGWRFERVTTHPGERLVEEFLKPLGIRQNQLALDLRVPANRIGQIVRGLRNWFHLQICGSRDQHEPRFDGVSYEVSPAAEG